MPLPNEGKYGVDSILLNGQEVEKMPLGTNNEARDQIADAIRCELESKAGDIIKRYPRLTKEYINGVLKEARSNIDKFRHFRDEKSKGITEYQRLIKDAHGKKTLREIEPEIEQIVASDRHKDEKVIAIRSLKDGCTPYDTEALMVQIEQFQCDVQRFDEAIQKENDTIAEWKAALAKIEIRDEQLKEIGIDTVV